MKWLQEKQAAVVFLFHFDELLALNRVLVEPSLLTPACDFVRLPSRVECEAESGGWVMEVILRVRRLAEAWQNTNDEGLFDPKTGRYDASRVANFLRVPLKELAKALGAKYTTVQKTLAAVALQEKLGPIGRVVELLVKFHGSQDVAREWLNTPHRELDERTPVARQFVAQPESPRHPRREHRTRPTNTVASCYTRGVSAREKCSNARRRLLA